MATKGKATPAKADHEGERARERDQRTAREINFEQARETSRVNHENDEKQNVVGGYDGVEVREGKNVEVINPVRNQATGKLEDDTRVVKTTPEEEVGATIKDTTETTEDK